VTAACGRADAYYRLALQAIGWLRWPALGTKKERSVHE